MDEHGRIDCLRQLLRDLTALHGVSGFEQEVARYFRKAVADSVDEVTVDRLGNVIAVRRGGPGPTLMLAAHLDEIGMIVKAVEPAGFLRFDKLGGTIDAFLPGQRVRVAGHPGVVGCRPGHFLGPEEQRRVVPHDDLYVDVGATSAEEVARMGIRVGSSITYEGSLLEFPGSTRVVGKAMDDRWGCAALIQLLRELADRPVRGTLYGVGTVMEEVGLCGAQVAAFRLNPDYAVAIDGLSAGDTPDTSFSHDVPIAMGRGPVIVVAASSAGNVRGGIAHPAVVRDLIATAERERIPYQLATHILRGSTDAAAIHLVREGIPSATVGVPRRYSYSPVEMVDLLDVERAVRLLLAFVAAMSGHDLRFLPEDA